MSNIVMHKRAHTHTDIYIYIYIYQSHFEHTKFPSSNSNFHHSSFSSVLMIK